MNSLEITNIFRNGSIINYKSINYYIGIKKDVLEDYKKEFVQSNYKDLISFLIDKKIIIIKLENIELIGKLK